MENKWRKDFPILDQTIYNKPLIYLDNAATSQMPKQVMDCVTEHFVKEHANIHRGIHYLSELSTSAVEQARNIVASFLHVQTPASVIFTAGTTDSIHLVASGIAQSLTADQGIITTELEHHSNYVPWQQICKQTGAAFHVCRANDGELDLNHMEQLLKENNIRLVAVTHISNLTGTVNPLHTIIDLAHRYGAEVLIDGAQGVLHRPVDVQDLDCDYYVFSGHKMLGPTGIGVLYGRMNCLEKLPPSRFGGGMVDIVTAEKTTWGPIPHRFEAGTANISGIIGLGEAITYLNTHDVTAMRSYEQELIRHVEKKLSDIEGLRILGTPAVRAGVVSFVSKDAHPYDIASMIDKAGIAVRSGNHCAQPALKSLDVTAATRISPVFYNTKEEIDITCQYLERVLSMLRKYK